MKALKIDPACNISVVEITPPLYEGLEKLLDGSPEHVRPMRLDRPYCFMMDDCALLKALPVNPVGSWLYQTDLHGSTINGDIYIMREEPSGGSYEVVGLTDDDTVCQTVKIISVLDKIKQAGRRLEWMK